MNSTCSRRAVMLAVASGASLLGAAAVAADEDGKSRNEDRGAGEAKDVGAAEDLMREHGVLRRALLVYQQSVPKLRSRAALDLSALNAAARLFRSFGEDYHEKRLEEAYIFPVLRKTRGPAAAYPDVLIAQHQRGREITDYVIGVTARARLGATHADALARAFESFVLMYQNHAAREDTSVFPAWKQALPERDLDEMGDRFEEIERQQFGKDGFETAVEQIAAIESALGYSDISRFTAPPPPKAG
jgi:hemerythrin-like domain-containing protein